MLHIWVIEKTWLLAVKTRHTRSISLLPYTTTLSAFGAISRVWISFFLHDVKYIRKFFTLRSFEVGCMRCYVFGKFCLENSMSFPRIAGTSSSPSKTPTESRYRVISFSG